MEYSSLPLIPSHSTLNTGKIIEAFSSLNLQPKNKFREIFLAYSDTHIGLTGEFRTKFGDIVQTHDVQGLLDLLWKYLPFMMLDNPKVAIIDRLIDFVCESLAVTRVPYQKTPHFRNIIVKYILDTVLDSNDDSTGLESAIITLSDTYDVHALIDLPNRFPTLNQYRSGLEWQMLLTIIDFVCEDPCMKM